MRLLVATAFGASLTATMALGQAQTQPTYPKPSKADIDRTARFLGVEECEIANLTVDNLIQEDRLSNKSTSTNMIWISDARCPAGSFVLLPDRDVGALPVLCDPDKQIVEIGSVFVCTKRAN